VPIDHTSDMRALRDVRKPLVNPLMIYVGDAIGDSVGDCGTIS